MLASRMADRKKNRIKWPLRNIWMMLMRSLSPLLAPPNTRYASQLMSRCFPCWYQWHWRAAAIPGIYRGLSPPPASVPACSQDPAARRAAAADSGCGYGAAMSSDLAPEVPPDTAPLWLATGNSWTWCLGARMVWNYASQSLLAQQQPLPPSTCTFPAPQLSSSCPRVAFAETTRRRHLRILLQCQLSHQLAQSILQPRAFPEEFPTGCFMCSRALCHASVSGTTASRRWATTEW